MGLFPASFSNFFIVSNLLLVVTCTLLLTWGPTVDASTATISRHQTVQFPLLMPEVIPPVNETYFCTSFRLPRSHSEYILEFEPQASKNIAHHILIYGCESPGYYERDSPRAIWDCGEMAEAITEYPRGPTCSKGSSIVYAWAMDAPKLTLPDGVGFKVGGDTGVNFLVLQVHYADVTPFAKGGRSDTSGIVLTLLPHNPNSLWGNLFADTTAGVSKRAGVLLLGTGGSIPTHTVTHMESACQMNHLNGMEMKPFAFRTHTHKLGLAVSGWKVDGKTKEWTLLGHHDPQKPQMFYPIDNKDGRFNIREGDIVAARCTMNNTRDHSVDIGSTGNDEMCNFYLMYYVEGDEALDRKYCFTGGPPYYNWNSDQLTYPVPPMVDQEASNPGQD